MPAAAAAQPTEGPTLRGRFGDPYVNQINGFANAGTSISPDWNLYGWLGYQRRHTSSAAFPRPTSGGTAGNAALAGYPQGFIPLIDTVSKDLNSAVGIKGTVGNGWDVDLSASYGRNKVAFRTEHSANYAYGAETPHSFYDGAVIYDQLVGNLDVTKTLPVFESLNLAFGLEARREGYQITPGEQASYGYPDSGPGLGAPGAQGFGGFSPLNAIKRHRENGSAYIDAEAQVTPKFLLAAAVRGETYSDFGEVATGKLSARYDFSHAFALRGTISTGFRAPALQQQYFTSISSVIVAGEPLPVLTGTFPSTDPVAKALGGLPLRPEKSTNFSLGSVIRFGGFDLTVDGYYIKLRDQLALSENLAAPGLLPPDVTAARFFINGIASHTEGVDVVGHYRLHTGPRGVFDFTAAANVNKIVVTHVPTSTSELTTTLFGRNRLLTLTEGTPGEKVSGAVDWSFGESRRDRPRHLLRRRQRAEHGRGQRSPHRQACDHRPRGALSAAHRPAACGRRAEPVRRLSGSGSGQSQRQQRAARLPVLLAVRVQRAVYLRTRRREFLMMAGGLRPSLASVHEAGPQAIAVGVGAIEHGRKRRMIDRLIAFIGDQVLLADVGDVAALGIFGEQMVEGLVPGRTDFFGNRFVPFVAVGEDRVDVEDHAAKVEQAVSNDVADPETRAGHVDRRGHGV